jgi:hypothetical protein
MGEGIEGYSKPVAERTRKTVSVSCRKKETTGIAGLAGED